MITANLLPNYSEVNEIPGDMRSVQQDLYITIESLTIELQNELERLLSRAKYDLLNY